MTGGQKDFVRYKLTVNICNDYLDTLAIFTKIKIRKR